jgi:hypothetical protein
MEGCTIRLLVPTCIGWKEAPEPQKRLPAVDFRMPLWLILLDGSMHNTFVPTYIGCKDAPEPQKRLPAVDFRMPLWLIYWMEGCTTRLCRLAFDGRMHKNVESHAWCESRNALVPASIE